MPHLIRQLTTSDGLSLHFREYSASSVTRGVVVALHGIQSHSGWYEYSSEKMADAGFTVYFADRRGSGMNFEQRGHADHGLRLLHDVRQLLRRVRREHPGQPVTLMGISWGGKIAAATAALCPDLVQQLVLMYPGLHPQIGPNVWQRIQLNFARRHDLRHRFVKLPLNDPALFTDVPHWQRFIGEDERALHHVTSGFLNAGRDLDRLIAQNRNAIAQPVLLMLAGNDRIIDNRRTQRTVTDFGSTAVTVRKYPNAAHTLEFDADREQIVDDLVDWLSTEHRR
ncbi:MAG: alpha/beta fold hydrolase [Planctomycetaceae bacterium]